ncbi:MAG: type I pantothenate kinase [Arcanobacterium sp.]|nr:type I pantothenate kinase [Arcanobacterium sp.]
MNLSESLRSQSRPAADSPYLRITANDWRALAAHAHLPLTADDVSRLAALGDPIDAAQADAIYRPLTELIQTYFSNTQRVRRESAKFLGISEEKTPWIIGIAGSVAVGKSTAARLLRELLSRWSETPKVDLITTDGFLLPNAELEAQNLMTRKGFPESYDRRSLLDFLAAVKSGAPNLKVPIYDHVTYDIVPGKTLTVDRPDILIVEGLNVLQPPRLSASDGEFRAVSDYFDFSIYLDAAESDLESWYLKRIHKLRETAFSDDRSFFRRYAHLSEEEVTEMGTNVWHSINLPNLRENIAPTRNRATVVLSKGSDHSVKEVWLRKL